MIAFVSEVGGDKWRERIERNKPILGRMWARDTPRKYFDWEKFTLDNGAYSSWVNGKQWDGDLFLRRFEKALEVGTPYFTVIPDIPGEGERSLEHSLRWRERFDRECPFYLAIQDGQTIDMIDPHIGKFDGLFLGGTLGFKSQAKTFCDYAHDNNINFHYARCSGVRVIDAYEMGADSIDSTTPAQQGELFYRRWERAFTTGGTDQPQMFSGLERAKAIATKAINDIHGHIYDESDYMRAYSENEGREGVDD